MRRLLPLLLLPMLTLLPGCVVARVPGPYYSEGYVAVPPPVYSRPYYGRPYYGRPYGYRRRHW